MAFTLQLPEGPLSPTAARALSSLNSAPHSSAELQMLSSYGCRVIACGGGASGSGSEAGSPPVGSPLQAASAQQAAQQQQLRK